MGVLTGVPKIADFVISTLTAFVILRGPATVTLNSHTVGGIFVNSLASGKCKDHLGKFGIEWFLHYRNTLDDTNKNRN
jgi:hypothetical protein